MSRIARQQARAALLVCSALFAVATNAAAAAPELVLHAQVQLTAQTPTGPLTVTAGEGIARRYGWAGCAFDAHMVQRSGRWMGSLGIYDPAPSHGAGAQPCQGLARAVVQEGQLHFSDGAAANAWLRRSAEARPTLWTADGLVVQWSVTLPRQQLNVDVWQLCVAGEGPARLPGAADAALQVRRMAGAGPERQACAAVGRDVVLETQTAWQQHWDSLRTLPARP